MVMEELRRRDEEIPRGTTLEVQVVRIYRVPIDENWVWDETDGPLTLEAVESCLGRDDLDRCEELRQNYDAVESEIGDWRVAGDTAFRFERPHEKTRRLDG